MVDTHGIDAEGVMDEDDVRGWALIPNLMKGNTKVEDDTKGYVWNMHQGPSMLGPILRPLDPYPACDSLQVADYIGACDAVVEAIGDAPRNLTEYAEKVKKARACHMRRMFLIIV